MPRRCRSSPEDGKASTSYLQRKLRIGYNSAARLIERMEADGHVSHPDHVGRRQVLIGGQDEDGRECSRGSGPAPRTVPRVAERGAARPALAARSGAGAGRAAVLRR